MNKRLRKGKSIALMVMLCAGGSLIAQVTDGALASSKITVTNQVVVEYTLLDVIKELEKVHDVIFDYRKNLLKDKSIRVSKSDLQTSSITQVLNAVLPQFGLEYKKYSERSYLIYVRGEEAPKKLNSQSAGTSGSIDHASNVESGQTALNQYAFA